MVKYEFTVSMSIPNLRLNLDETASAKINKANIQSPIKIRYKCLVKKNGALEICARLKLYFVY